MVRDGTVVLPARLILDVVRSLPAQSVTLELRSVEQDVELVSGNATFHIRTLRSEDFPPFPEPDESSAVELPAGRVRLDRAEGRRFGLARRDASGADGDSRVGL